MKKITFILVATLITLGANAKIKGGVKAGLNLSSLSSVSGISFSYIPPNSLSFMNIDALENDGMTVGFHVGGFLNFSFGKFIGIQPELMFSMQGSRQIIKPALVQIMFRGLQSFGNLSMDFVFNYINLPVLLEVKPMSGLSILLGPQIGYNFYKSETMGGETKSGADFDYVFNNEVLDISIVMGLQYTFAEHFIFGARYTLGMINKYIPSQYEFYEITYELSGWKNNVVQLYFGYAF